MTITVHFRGVALFVRKNDVVTEVFFPRADQEPPDGTSEKLHDPKDPGTVIGTLLRHADGSVANLHFAGALLLHADQTTSYRRLTGCRVEPKGGGGNGADVKAPFRLPPLDDIIKKNKKLKLKKSRSSSCVATHFILKGGSITANSLAQGQWGFIEPDGEAKETEYSLEATWTIETDELELKVTDVDSGKLATIKLDADTPEVFFYNFDRALPVAKELTDDLGAPSGTVDHDFKWIYKLLKNNDGKWQNWLTQKFPAPVRIGSLVSVSTCFQAVWTGDEET